MPTTNVLSIETMVRIETPMNKLPSILINPQCLNFGADLKEIGCLPKKNIQGDYKIRQSVRIAKLMLEPHHLIV